MKASFKKRYKSLLNSLSAGIVVHNTDTKIIDCNQKAKEILGLEEESLNNYSALPESWHLINEEGEELPVESYPVHRILQNGNPVDEQIIGIRQNNDHSEAWFRVSGLPILDEKGEICEVMISFIDISDEKRAIKRSEDRDRAYQQLFQTMSQGVIYQNSDGHIITANPSAERILNLPADQIKGMHSNDTRWRMIDEEGTPVEGKNHPSMLAMRAGKVVGPVIRGMYVPEWEKYVWLKLTAIPQFKEGESRPWSAFTTFEDITEQREKDAELRKLSTAVEQSPVSVVITDTEGRIEYVNSKFESITGYSANEVLGKNSRVLNSGEQKPEFYEEMWDTILLGNIWRGEFKNRKKNGDLYWESATISPILNEQGVAAHFLALKEDITKLKTQEIKLKESEKRFRELFETLPEISVQGYNANREVIYWNKASERLYGYTKEQSLGKKLEDLIIPEEMKQDVVHKIKRSVENNISIPSSELVLKHADGSSVPVYSNHTMIQNQHDEKELYCIDINLKELKEKEAKLRKAEERYRSIIEVSNIGAWEYDIERDELWLSPKNFSMLGYDREEKHYDPGDGLDAWKNNLHPDDRENAFNKFQDYISGDLNETYEDQFRLLHKNGSPVWVFLRGRILKNPDGTLSNSFLGTHIDITDRILYEEKIKESDLYHRSLLETIPDLIFVVDRKGRFLDYNATEQNLYVNKDEFLGYSIEEIFPEEIAFSHQQATERSFKENKPVEFQYSLFENGSKRDFSSKVTAFGREKVITIVRDISERESNIRKLEKLLKIKEQQNKKLSNFTHIVSHNLRTHSANMKGLLSLLEIEKPELVKDQYIQMVAASVDYLGDTIDNLNQVLKIHNAQNDNVPSISLLTHLEKAIKQVTHLAEKNKVKIINDVSEDIKVQALPSYMDSVIYNMLTNAIKYRSEERESLVKIFCKKEDDSVVLAFQDNGLGIDLDLYGSKLFGMYQTFHSNKDSVGLGLFITKSQIEEMGGSIQVTSSIEVGTTFKIRLPYGKN